LILNPESRSSWVEFLGEFPKSILRGTLSLIPIRIAAAAAAVEGSHKYTLWRSLKSVFRTS
jgi:hypothetical protein